MATPDWKDTVLWQALDSRGHDADQVKRYVESWLQDVQTLLSSGGTAPLDFTLHDDQHSYRVAQRMAELLPDKTFSRLSDLELGLLLKSAYLHDIGMNPRRELVKIIREYLLDGGGSDLPADEQQQLQRWLDEKHPGVQPPILTESPTTERVGQAEYLTAYYCRHRHNDWSGDYITETACFKGNAPYATWIDDLIALCRSHHFGLDALMADTFDLRIVGSNNRLVKLRYLAALLRLADVLEFDPERTPSVIMDHRAIVPQSRIFWYKDQSIVLGLERDTPNVIMAARTKDAWIHKAVLDTADDVDRELLNCAIIEKQNGFAKGVKISSANFYLWSWPTRTTRDVKPVSNSFEYIDGAFRPNTRRLLSLLAGTRLYGQSIAAVRELLQNAFDAVREQLAHEALSDPPSTSVVTTIARSALHRVEISLDEFDGARWLICKDTGVGMTRRVIERYLLVSGSQPRPETLELERRCSARGLGYQRSGEFGIGVLSYFMLSDKLVIETRASNDAYSDAENHGWRFETGGLGSFGELRSFARTSRGSTIKLRLKDEYADLAFGKPLREYIFSVVTKSPCTLITDIDGSTRSMQPGWINGSDQFSEVCLQSFQPRRVPERGLVSRERADREERALVSWGQYKKAALEAIRFFGPIEQELPNGMGQVRVHLPYFQLEGGASLYFMSSEEGRVSVPDQGAVLTAPDNLDITSWRGFQVSRFVHELYRGNRDEPSNVPIVTERSVFRGATISIDRTNLVLNDSGEIDVAVIATRERLVQRFFFENADSPYAELSPAWARAVRPQSGHRPSYWAFPDGPVEAEESETTWRWREVQFPAVVVPQFIDKYAPRLAPDSLHLNRLKDELRPLRRRRFELMMPLPTRMPSRLMLGRLSYRLEPMLLYEVDSPEWLDSRLGVRMPDEWPDLLAIAGGVMIFNSEHVLWRWSSMEQWCQYLDMKKSLPGISELCLTSLKSPQIAACFLVDQATQSSEHWNALRDNLGDDYRRLFGVIADVTGWGGKFLVWQAKHPHGVRSVDSSGARFSAGFVFGENLGNLLPVVTDRSWFFEAEPKGKLGSRPSSVSDRP